LPGFGGALERRLPRGDYYAIVSRVKSFWRIFKARPSGTAFATNMVAVILNYLIALPGRM